MRTGGAVRAGGAEASRAVAPPTGPPSGPAGGRAGPVRGGVVDTGTVKAPGAAGGWAGRGPLRVGTGTVAWKSPSGPLPEAGAGGAAGRAPAGAA